MTAPIKAFAPATVFEDEAFDDHEQVVFCSDRRTGLSAIIAVHDSRLGPALGGTRMWDYASGHQALTDVLRLSRGMTFKNALAGIPYGGGKAVILGNAARDKTEPLLRAFGGFVDGLAGRYITAEDVGMSAADMEIIATRTRHVRGTRATGLGDPSPYTALGVFHAIKATVRARFATDRLADMTFAVQGLGHVGSAVARHLHRAGAKLVVADIDPRAVAAAVSEFGAETAPVETVHAADCDVFVPCALGAVLDRDAIPRIRARAVVGAANNQLASIEDGERLQRHDILYAPDYVVNAGGVISIALAEPGGDDAAVLERIAGIADTLQAIFAESADTGLPPAVIADRMARRIVDGS